MAARTAAFFLFLFKVITVLSARRSRCAISSKCNKCPRTRSAGRAAAPVTAQQIRWQWGVISRIAPWDGARWEMPQCSAVRYAASEPTHTHAHTLRSTSINKDINTEWPSFLVLSSPSPMQVNVSTHISGTSTWVYNFKSIWANG